MRAFGVIIVAFVAISATIAERPTERDGQPVVYSYKNGEACPAQNFYLNCNSCMCLPNGHAAGCTRMQCFEEHNVKKREIEDPLIPKATLGYRQGEKCPAAKFYLRCNLCECGQDGHSAVCENNPCLPFQKPGIN